MEKNQKKINPLKENFEKGQTKPPRQTAPPPPPKPRNPPEKQNPPQKG